MFVDVVGDRTGEVSGHRKEADAKLVLGPLFSPAAGLEHLGVKPKMHHRDQSYPGDDKRQNLELRGQEPLPFLMRILGFETRAGGDSRQYVSY
jgi:hypothetical protein